MNESINNNSNCDQSDRNISQNDHYLIQDDLRKKKELNFKKRKNRKIHKDKKKVIITNG